MHIQYKFKSSAWWYLVTFVIILFCILAFRISYTLYQNHDLRERYSAKSEDNPYQRGIPLEEMDLSEYDHVFNRNIAPMLYNLTHNINTPVTLRYYNEIPTDDTDVALEITEGTTITAIPLESSSSLFQELGYGYTSYPTYTKGWRYVKPFSTETAGEDSAQHKFYYIRIESLEAVLRETINSNQSLFVSVGRQNWLNQTASHSEARYIDQALYAKGIYLSPDLTHKVWNHLNILLMSLTGIFGAVLLCLNFRSVIKRQIEQ